MARSLKAQTLASWTICTEQVLCMLFKYVCQDNIKATLILNWSKNCSEKMTLKILRFLICYKKFYSFHPCDLHLRTKMSGLRFLLQINKNN